jgi:hypothetical protein
MGPSCAVEIESHRSRAESILKHIEEAIQEGDDRSDRAFKYAAIRLEEARQLRHFFS